LLRSHLPCCSFSERHWDIHSLDSSRQKHRKYLQDKTKTFSPDWMFREKSSLHCFSQRCTTFYLCDPQRNKHILAPNVYANTPH
jgi:hypothetical protein